MNFAKKQLEKYGWTVGKGLGPREDGIAVALKPMLKRSKSGLGHDLATEHTDHWWTSLYNKAADNVVVNSGEAGEHISTKYDNSFNIASETWKITHTKQHQSNKGKYDSHFVKKAVLTNNKTEGVSDPESSSDDDVPTKDVLKMTDEELFAACGGRTAHKAARHGIRANGKLSRIEEQEKLLLAHPKFEGYSHAKLVQTSNTLNNVEIKTSTSIGNEEIVKKKKKRKLIAELDEIETLNQRHNEITLVKKKYNKKSKCNAKSNEAAILDPVDSKINISVKRNKKEKRKCNTEIYEPEELTLVQNQNLSLIKEHKKKKKNNIFNTEPQKIETFNLSNNNGVECDVSIIMASNKKKNTKHKFEIENTISESVSVEVDESSDKTNNKTLEDAGSDLEVEDKQTPNEDAAVTGIKMKKKKKKRNKNK